MSLGVLWFSVVDANHSPRFDVKGMPYLNSCIFVIICALAIDAVTPNLHEKFLNEFRISALESVKFILNRYVIPLFSDVLL